MPFTWLCQSERTLCSVDHRLLDGIISQTENFQAHSKQFPILNWPKMPPKNSRTHFKINRNNYNYNGEFHLCSKCCGEQIVRATIGTVLMNKVIKEWANPNVVDSSSKNSTIKLASSSVISIIQKCDRDNNTHSIYFSTHLMVKCPWIY